MVFRNLLLRSLVLRNLRALFCAFALLLPAASSAQDAQDIHPIQPNQPGQGVHSVPSFVEALTDRRFDGVDEDWTSPGLTTSHLRPVEPMVLYVNEQPGHSVSLVRVQWRRGDPIDLYLIKPSGVKKPPVILSLYGYPSDTDIFKNPEWQKFTTQGGFASVGFVTALTGHRYHDIPMQKWFLSELQQCLGESAHDVQMVLNYLASRGDLDMDRVGVVGQFSGASIGILASAVDPRIKVLDTIDPWGDWPTWMQKSAFPPKVERANYVTPDFLAKVAPLDTLNWIPKVQAKKFRLQQRHYDQQTPIASKQKMQAAVPEGTTVAFYDNMNEFDKEVGVRGEKSLDWIKAELKSLPEGGSSSAVAAKTEGGIAAKKSD
jgi:hypothetical protein